MISQLTELKVNEKLQKKCVIGNKLKDSVRRKWKKIRTNRVWI